MEDGGDGWRMDEWEERGGRMEGRMEGGWMDGRGVEDGWKMEGMKDGWGGDRWRMDGGMEGRGEEDGWIDGRGGGYGDGWRERDWKPIR